MNRRTTNRRTIDASTLRRPRVLLALLAVVAAALAVWGPTAPSADAAISPHDPRGHVDWVSRTATGVFVRGWAIDPDTAAPVVVGVSVNHVTTAYTTANLPRPDIAQRYPASGPNHGFQRALTLKFGTYTICAWAKNVGTGTNRAIGCQTAVVNGDPSGSLDYVTAKPGAFTVTGGASDPSTAGPISVDVYADGVKQGRLLADQPLHGQHGYSGTFPISQGKHTICVTGINVGAGSNHQIACKPFTLDESPVGGLATVTQTSGGISVTGWASDPDTTAPITVTVTVSGVSVGTVTANRSGTTHAGHNFAGTFRVRNSGTRPVCAVATNVSYGTDRAVACRTVVLNYDPTATIDALAQKSPGFTVSGWAKDPDTSSPINVRITADGTELATVLANGLGSPDSGYRFTRSYPLAPGKHTVCAIALNVSSGAATSVPSCRDITLNFDPFGRLDSAARAGTTTPDLAVTGWAIDPDTTKPISVAVKVDGVTAKTAVANVTRTDVQKLYPAYGAAHGFSTTVPADDKEHRVCATAVNVSAGTNKDLGCTIVNAVNPVPPTAPGSVAATPDYGAATVSWTAPTDDGGAPWTGYVVTSSPGNITVKVGPTLTTARVTGLTSGGTYTFSVKAVNVAGASPAGTSPAVKTLVGPPPQTTPAPISTSRYIRNITGAGSTDLAKLRAAGVADARANPAGHRYLMLLDIGGQSGNGVVLSATTRYLSNTALLANMKAYVDGYASAQKAGAPAHITVGTNNDIDVSYTAGQTWARQIVNPLVSYAAKYPNLVISGANDIEPGFRGSQSATTSWVKGYLSATSAKFVFNGSADGCAWTVTNRACNNGWTMAGLHNLAAGLAPSRIINLPQIYNTTMAAQWKYISLTGVQLGKARINFGGPLTEWTACSQAGSCGSLTGNYAWSQMWKQLQSHPALKVSSLPYSTDLRIDR